MKSHISATIERELVDALNQIRRRERRSFSNVLEAAVAEFVDKRRGTEEYPVSPGRFEGRFSRRETYARTKR